MRGQDGLGAVNLDLERGNAVRVDDGGRVARLLDVLDLVVAVGNDRSVLLFARENCRTRGETDVFPRRLRNARMVLAALRTSWTRAGTPVYCGKIGVSLHPPPGCREEGLTNSEPEKERAEAIWRSPSSLAMQSASPSLSMMATLEKLWPKLTPSKPGCLFFVGSCWSCGVDAPDAALLGALDAALLGALDDLFEPFWLRLGGILDSQAGATRA